MKCLKTAQIACASLLLLIVFCFGKCTKEKIDDNGLPAATQEGKNTLGFMLNGQPWTPKGMVGLSANLTVDVDFGYKQGIFTIAAYKIISNGVSESFGIGLKDSLNLLSIPTSLQISISSLPGVRYRSITCSYYSTDIQTYTSGSLTITKLDRTNRIIAGTFSATLAMPGCDTIRITEGRFDMKY